MITSSMHNVYKYKLGKMYWYETDARQKTYFYVTVVPILTSNCYCCGVIASTRTPITFIKVNMFNQLLCTGSGTVSEYLMFIVYYMCNGSVRSNIINQTTGML